MACRRAVVIALLAAALLPAQAEAKVRMVARDVPLGATTGPSRVPAARPAPLDFNMVGLHWRGSGTVWFRTATDSGSWSAWRPAAPEVEDGSDPDSPEAAASGAWHLGSPYWTGAAGRIQYRLAGSVTRLRAFFIASDVGTAPEAAPTRSVASGVAARPSRPRIIRRRAWGANERIVRGEPIYADRVRLAIVHHTAGTNSYSRSESAAIVRGIQRYHVQANGWNDIGYNFLVSKHGQVFEGRAGGITRAVLGAHAGGFNTGSAGVAVLGTYSGVPLSRAARRALRRLLAWRLDVAHVDPRSRLTYTSFGNERFAPGARVRLRAVSGHRDTGSTTCPGSTLYGSLGRTARAVARIGLPKLYNPVVRGRLGGPVRFTARLSSARAWTVTVRDSAEAVVASGRGQGAAVDWTWDSAAAPFAAYRWRIASGTAVRPANGRVPAPPPLAIRKLKVDSAVITPNGDENADSTRISFALSRRATVRLTVARPSGALVRTLIDDQELAGGRAGARWAGRDDDGAPVADGRYRVRMRATSGSQRLVRSREVVVDRTLARAGRTYYAFSPNGDGRRDRITFVYELTAPADIRVGVVKAGRRLGTITTRRAVPAGRHELVWNGRLDGRRLADGRYLVSVQATAALGTRTLTRSFRIDTARPVARILSARVVDGVTRVRFSLSESGRVRIWYGTRVWDDGDFRDLRDRPAGAQRSSRSGVFGAVRLAAWDRAGNRSRPALAEVVP